YMYAPCTVRANVAGGVQVVVEEQTNFPFEESIEFAVETVRPVRFPLYLRGPTWTDHASISINGAPVEVKLTPGQVRGLDGEWEGQTTIKLAVPMAARIKTWPGTNTVSVIRGPLTYSLAIPETTTRYAGTGRWPAFDLTAGGPWNYGLEVDPAKTDAGLGKA